jgi:hypothetical protein
VPKSNSSRRFAERSLVGIDDVGNEERITLWIEYQPEALWAVGRVVNPQLRDSDEPKEEDFIFRGFELDDALNEANGAESSRSWSPSIARNSWPSSSGGSSTTTTNAALAEPLRLARAAGMLETGRSRSS